VTFPLKSVAGDVIKYRSNRDTGSALLRAILKKNIIIFNTTLENTLHCPSRRTQCSSIIEELNKAINSLSSGKPSGIAPKIINTAKEKSLFKHFHATVPGGRGNATEHA
jgi:hypothetical protein